uniref:Uncharacterized protein n=1 Tax=Cacopsylla melanoneura TaxID=428564 RepID=A0A8D9E906_9HEMI
MDRLSYTVNVYDVLSAVDIQNNKINLLPQELVVMGEKKIFYYILTSYGDSNDRNRVKRFFWVKLFKMFEPYYQVLSLTEWASIRIFFDHCVWIDRTPIEVSLKGCVKPPSIFRKLVEAWNLNSSRKNEIRPRLSDGAPTKNDCLTTVKALYAFSVLTVLITFSYTVVSQRIKRKKNSSNLHNMVDTFLQVP